MRFSNIKDGTLKFLISVFLLTTCCTPKLIGELENKNFSTASKMIEDGENIQVESGDGFTPLMYASFYGELDLVKTLVSKGANINSTTKEWKDVYGDLNLNDSALTLALRN